MRTEVWTALRGIPAGEPVSYGELAAAIGRPLAARAVGWRAVPTTWLRSSRAMG